MKLLNNEPPTSSASIARELEQRLARGLGCLCAARPSPAAPRLYLPERIAAPAQVEIGFSTLC